MDVDLILSKDHQINGRNTLLHCFSFYEISLWVTPTALRQTPDRWQMAYAISGVFSPPHNYWAIWSVLSIAIVVLVLSYLCHIVHSIVHVRPRFCSYKRSRDYLSCSFSLIDNLPWFLLSPDYIYLSSKTLATVYLWYI